MEFVPLYFKDKVNIINPKGNTCIVTLWTKLDAFKDLLNKKSPELLENNSPLVTIANLYGSGLPQMLANLAYNPQIKNIIITGANLSGSAENLINFFNKGVEKKDCDGIIINKIIDTDFPLDENLKPELFEKINIKRFEINEIDKIIDFLKEESNCNINNDDINDSKRVKITLQKPEFKDFPSDIFNHNVVVKTPIEGWMEIMHLLDRYGKTIKLEKGTRRALFNLDVEIKDASFEDYNILKKFNFCPEELKEYKKSILNGNLLEDSTYTYGNRLRSYWGIDGINEVIKRLKSDKTDRHCLISLWDTRDIGIENKGKSKSPCFTDVYFMIINNKLVLTAHFRTHNAVNAWLVNVYGLRSIQEFIAKELDIECGEINLRSRWIGIDPENAKTISALKLIKQHREKPFEANDPRGFFTVDIEDNKIVIIHSDNNGIFLEKFIGDNAKEIKGQLRKANAIIDPDHALWIGYELARAQNKIKGKLEEF